MLRKFWGDVRGNFAMLTGIAMVPILGGLALAIDFVDMSRQRQDTLNALDAATMATALRVLEGASEAQVRQYAREFFDANLASVKPEDAELEIFLPTNMAGGGRVRLVAHLEYDAIFLPPFRALLDRTRDPDHSPLKFQAASEVQLRNTVEVALVLDNSGSMDYYGAGSGKKRIDLLKSAAKELVEKLASTATTMRQVERPVQFSLVPFAASVNIGPSNRGQAWMDMKGLSPIHHENFDWSTMTGSKRVAKDGPSGEYMKRGDGWLSGERNTPVTRFTVLDDLRRCSDSSCTSRSKPDFATWGGCVEARPSPYNTNDELPNDALPSTLYVPMFAPDEAGDFNWRDNNDDNLVNFGSYNSWWNDRASSDSTSASAARTRQRNASKYFAPLPRNASNPESDKGPNASCTTKPVTPLTDVTTTAGLNAIKNAIDNMSPLGATNVPEGLAWGWRTLSSQAPFTGGRPETERGNDKVVIVLTDGANTYYTPSSLGGNDTAGNKSTYSAYGYAYLIDPLKKVGRIFDGTSSQVDKSDFDNDNYSKAMNEQFLKTCENANGGDTGSRGAGLIIMTVALDLNDRASADRAQLDMLKQCASRSRYARDPDDITKGKKLFWNATSQTLSQTFKEIADELSNLRFVG